MTEEQELTARGGCPKCRTTIPFKRYLSGRGQPFECIACRSTVYVAKASVGLAIAGFALLAAIGDAAPFWFVVFMIFVAVILEWLLSKVVLVKDGVNAPSANGS